MSNPLTLESLVAAIRDPGTTMEDLTHLVGPSPEEQARHEANIARIDRLWARADREGWGREPDFWVAPYHQQHLCLQNETSDFEQRYC
jgi:hypothetical protein